MGYSARYEGSVALPSDLTIPQLAIVRAMLGEDSRRHPDWGQPKDEPIFVQVELSDDLSSLRWDGTEKCDDMAAVLNLVTRVVRKSHPGFKLSGSMEAVGEDGERWRVAIGPDGAAKNVS